MPRKSAKPKEAQPRASLNAKRIDAVALKVDELPHLTFFGKSFSEAKRNMLSELTRLYPQGFDLEFPEFADRVLDKTLSSLSNLSNPQ